MGGSYPRTENRNYDKKWAKHVKETERRIKAMEKSLIKKKIDIKSLDEIIKKDIAILNAKYESDCHKEAERNYSEPQKEEAEYMKQQCLDVSRIDDVETSVYPQMLGDKTKTPEEISYEILAKLEILDENNNLPNYKQFSSMPKYSKLDEKEKVQIYLEYRQGLIYKMRAEREEGYDLSGFETDPEGKPLTKAEKIQQYRNIKKIIEKGFSNKALEILANSDVYTTEMIDPEEEGVEVSKN